MKQHSIYADIPPPCQHGPHEHEDSHGCMLEGSSFTSGESNIPSQSSDVQIRPRYHLFPQNYLNTSASTRPPLQPSSTAPKIQRQKSVSRRVISKFKEGISSRSKSSISIRPAESDNSLVRRISGRRKQSSEADRRTHSLELSGDSVESAADTTAESFHSASHADQPSFTGSAASTHETLRDSFAIEPSRPSEQENTSAAQFSRIQDSSPPPPSSPSPLSTPRPPGKNLPPSLRKELPYPSIAVPCVDLEVASDCTTVDVHSKRDVWVAMKATIRAKERQLQSPIRPDTTLSDSRNLGASTAAITAVGECLPSDAFNKRIFGNITHLRLCYKAVEGCRIREIIGQKYTKDLALGQQCSLFIKLRVPRIRTRDSGTGLDQESLFTELESIVGALETEIMHIEARYRHSILPSDNVVTVRHVCKVKRPKFESRWSILECTENFECPTHVHEQLARYISSHYPPAQALELIDRYLSSDLIRGGYVDEMRRFLVEELRCSQEADTDQLKPSVVVTDIDLGPSVSSIPQPECFSSAPSTPVEIDRTSQHSSASPNIGQGRQPSSTSLVPSAKLAPPLISAPRTTTALTTQASPSLQTSLAPDQNEHPESQDSARKLWQHIRRTSLSAKQLEEMTPERVQHLEASDEALKELRRKALANKRSVGAETLKGWKWEESMQRYERQGEAPWM